MSQINYHYTDEAYPDSEAIKSVHFDSKHNDALVSFRHGGQYIVDDVTQDEFFDLVDADSVGAHYRQNWRGVKDHERVEVMNFVQHDDTKGFAFVGSPDAEDDDTPQYFKVAGLLGAEPDPEEYVAAAEDTEVETTDETYSLRALVDAVAAPAVDDEVESEEANPNVAGPGAYGRPYEVTLVLRAESLDEALQLVRDSYVVEDNDGEVLSVRAY